MKSPRNIVQIAVILAAVGAAASAATADTRSRTAAVKPGSDPNITFTSWMFETDNSRAVVNPPPGWTANHQGGRSWHITANAGTAGIGPGGSFTVDVTNQGGVGNSIKFTGADYADATGKTVWVQSCGDPVGVRVVGGGATGASYLGYPIPAGQYGYFYTQWAPDDALGVINQTQINIGANSGAHNFQVIPNSFAASARPGFDLNDLQPSPLEPADGFVYQVQHFMEPADALGMPGIPTGWSFDAASGVGTMDFMGGGGLGAGQSSSIVAFTSIYEPMTVGDNVVYIYDSFGCPQSGYVYNGTLVPSVVPTPGSAALMAIGGVLALRRRRR